MADTLEESLTSIADQINNDFEILIVDDGSNDNSVNVIKKLQEKFKSIRLLQLPRDKKRKLGITRNISIQEAKGAYVLLHLDCDDVWMPYIVDFTKAFHQIEAAAHTDLFVQGQHIAMAKREFLLNHGPYENMYRGEDRNLWAKMAEINAYIPFEHSHFHKRLPKTIKRNTFRSIYHTWDHLVNDFRSGTPITNFVFEDIRNNTLSIKLKILRLMLAIPCWLYAQFQEPIFVPENMKNPENFIAYINKRRGTLSQILNHYNVKPAFEEFSSEGRSIFS